jgi:molybdate transport system substrate-binding protein
MMIQWTGVLAALAGSLAACRPAPEVARPAEAAGAAGAVGSAAGGGELHVMSSAGFAAAYGELAPDFQCASRTKIRISYGPSLGTAPDAIPSRMRRGERVDAVIMASPGLAALIEQGKVVADSRVDLARSRIGVAVRAGARRPDISTAAALKQALLDARSIAYSDSVSGIYVSTELFQRLGIADQVRGKSIQIQSERVGGAVARGDAEIGFQQMSELLPVAGIDVVGPIPAEVQKVTVFSAAVATGARNPQAARALLRFLSSPSAFPAITKSGLEPIGLRRE